MVVDAYNFSWTDKRINELRDAVGSSLVQLGAASACKAGLLGKQAGYLPGPETVRSVVEQMRAELLEEGPVSDETAVLVALLERVKCLKAYFSAFEQKAVRQKIEALAQSPEGKMVRDMMTYLQIIMYSFAARGAAAAGS